MSGKGKRRSARLLRLEEQQKNDGGGGGGGGHTAACLLDPWQIIRNSISGAAAAARGKRKRSDAEIQKLQGEASCSHPAIDAAAAYTNNVQSSQLSSSTGQIIEYILDTLELRDTHELFAMPDDIQMSDYAERVSRPGDFATLRQKNTDGMYTTLEQFENDVYMVFHKAITKNSQDTIPYREAMSLMDQAKQVFLSLKSNQMYSEPELMAWRQKHLDVVGPSKAAREVEGSGGGPCDVVAAAAANREQQQRQRPSPPAKKAGAAAGEKKQQAAGRAGNASAENGRGRPRGPREGGKSTPGKRARKVTAAVVLESGGAGVERRRLTYNDEASPGSAAEAATTATVLAFQELNEGAKCGAIVQRPPLPGYTYQDSLQRFVRNAGLKARLAAEFRSLECETRARQNPAPPAYWNGFAPGAGMASGFLPYGGSHYPPLPPPPSAASWGGSHYPPPPPPPSVASWGGSHYPRPPPLPSAAIWGDRDFGEQALPECKLETDELLNLAVLIGTPAFLERAKQMFGGAPVEESSSREGHVATVCDDETAGATAAAAQEPKSAGAIKPAAPEQSSGASKPAAPEQSSGASKPAGDFGPFAPPKLVPGRLGFGQFASSSAGPFKAKPPTMLKSPGKKKATE